MADHTITLKRTRMTVHKGDTEVTHEPNAGVMSPDQRKNVFSRDEFDRLVGDHMEGKVLYCTLKTAEKSTHTPSDPSQACPSGGFQQSTNHYTILRVEHPQEMRDD